MFEVFLIWESKETLGANHKHNNILPPQLYYYLFSWKNIQFCLT